MTSYGSMIALTYLHRSVALLSLGCSQSPATIIPLFSGQSQKEYKATNLALSLFVSVNLSSCRVCTQYRTSLHTVQDKFTHNTGQVYTQYRTSLHSVQNKFTQYWTGFFLSSFFCCYECLPHH